MKYDVHLFVAVRIKVSDVEAESMEAAFAFVEDHTDPREFLPPEQIGGSAVWDEGPALGALIDVVGDEDFGRSTYLQGSGADQYLTTKNLIKLHN